MALPKHRFPGKIWLAGAALMALFAPQTQAQHFTLVITPPPPVETVIVTAPGWLGDHPQTVIHTFVRAYAMAAPVSGEITRWRTGICPLTRGLSQEEFNAYVSARIREVAKEAGAPLQAPDCHVNINVLFTDKPQDALDQIRKNGGARLLGPTPSHAESEGVMNHAVQAWYSTATRDTNGVLMGDDEDQEAAHGMSVWDLPQHQVQGSLLRTDLRGELEHIVVIADTTKTKDYQLGAVADYIAVLALSQTQSFEDCKPIPSITNLVSPNCGDELRPTAITDTDMAFLKAVYTMDPGMSALGQQTYISGEIGKTFGVR